MFDWMRKCISAIGGIENADYETKPTKMKGWMAVRHGTFDNSLETSQIYFKGWRSFSNWEKHGYVIQEVEVLVRKRKNEIDTKGE